MKDARVDRCQVRGPRGRRAAVRTTGRPRTGQGVLPPADGWRVRLRPRRPDRGRGQPECTGRPWLLWTDVNNEFFLPEHHTWQEAANNTPQYTGQVLSVISGRAQVAPPAGTDIPTVIAELVRIPGQLRCWTVRTEKLADQVAARTTPDPRSGAFTRPGQGCSVTRGVEGHGPKDIGQHAQHNAGPFFAATPQNPAMDLSSTPANAP